MRYVLNDLSRESPDWLKPLIEPDWLERYGKRVDDYRLPKGKQARTELAEQIGQDGWNYSRLSKHNQRYVN